MWGSRMWGGIQNVICSHFDILLPTGFTFLTHNFLDPLQYYVFSQFYDIVFHTVQMELPTFVSEFC